MLCKPARYTTMLNPTPIQICMTITAGIAKLPLASHCTGWLMMCSFMR